MARYNLDQIRQMTPDFGGMLQSMGLTIGGENEDGTPRYMDREGNWVSPSVVQDMVSGGELKSHQNEFLRDQGIIDASMLTDISEVNKQAGLNLQNPDDYWKYIYGAGDRVGDYWVLPEGQRYDQYKNAPPSLTHYDSADKFGALTKGLVLGGITAGMTGMLPGTESIFGAGGGATAGLDAAWGVNPAADAAGVFGGDIAGTTAAGEVGGGFFSGIGDFVSSLLPTGGQGGGNPFTMGDLAGTALNYFLNQQASGDLSNAANQALEAGNPLNDPKRQPYQQQLAQLLANPTSFYETNPVVKAQMDLARRQFEANSAKMGVGGTQSAAYLKNIQNNAANTFNTQAELLSGLGGFGFPGGGGTNAFMQGQQAATNANQNSTAMFADLAKNVFGNTQFGQKPVKDIFSGFDFSLG